MPKHLLSFSLLLLIALVTNAQTPIANHIKLNNQVSKEIQLKLLNKLDTLLLQINDNKPDTNIIDHNGAALNFSIFSSMKGIENNEKEKDAHFYKPRLINLYPVNSDSYFISLAFISGGSELRAIIDFVATINNGSIKFATPLSYLTRNWKTTKTGNITYYYPDRINLLRAKKFDQQNKNIALKLGLQPEKFDFYLCDNYQEILRLMGYEYDSEAAGMVGDGYGVDANTIFSIMHNEDFSHDTFHYYAAKIRKAPRNSAAEEGVAYSWGNAYYTDANGEMITQQQLVKVLKQYLQHNPQTSLLQLFYKAPMIFYGQTKVRSLLASLICDEVERRRGTNGIKILLNCGSGDDNFFKIADQLVGINAANFDKEVGELIARYK